MKIIRPVIITDSVLTSSNVLESDYPEYNPATSYNVGDRVIVLATHKVYEALKTTTGQYPPDNTGGTSPAWLDLGATNRWRMFDGSVDTITSNASLIDVDLQPSAIVNSVAFFGLDATRVSVTVTDSVEGIVYDRSVDLQDLSGVSDWYTYYFEPISRKSDLVLLDLPPYSTATINVSIEESGGVADCALVVIGTLKTLGETNYGTAVGITDYSRKEVDDFGNAVILQRRFSKIADYDVTINTPRVSDVQKTLAKYRTTPLVWIGDEDFEETIIYGYYRDFDITISTFSVSDCTIEVEGLS